MTYALIFAYLLFYASGVAGFVNVFTQPSWNAETGNAEDGLNVSRCEFAMYCALCTIPVGSAVGNMFWLVVLWQRRQLRTRPMKGVRTPCAVAFKGRSAL